jgi:hypothetical protein
MLSATSICRINNAIRTDNTNAEISTLKSNNISGNITYKRALIGTSVLSGKPLLTSHVADNIEAAIW